MKQGYEIKSVTTRTEVRRVEDELPLEVQGA